MSSAGRDALVAMLSRLKQDLSGLDLSKPDTASKQLLQKYPLNGDYLVEVRRLCERGLEDGWLCVDGDDGVASSRLAGSSTYFPYSIEALALRGDARPHRHPKGEISLCWTVEGKPEFCGNKPGWVVSSPGSKHVPEVKGGRMLILNFLPEGAIDWKVKASSRKTASRKRTTRTTRSASRSSRRAAATS